MLHYGYVVSAGLSDLNIKETVSTKISFQLHFS